MKLQFSAFVLSAAALVFAYGVAVGVYEVFPYKPLKLVMNSAEAVWHDRERLLTDRPVGFLTPSQQEGGGVTVLDPAGASPGLTLLSGFFDDLPEIRLVDLQGALVRRWPVSYLGLFPSSDHILPSTDVPATDWNAAVHGMDILPDGSVIFNFDAKGTVKLDRCGNTVWTLPRMTHHSIDRSEDGTFWIPSRNYIEEESPYPLFRTPFWDDTILQVSEDGEVLFEVSVNEILINSGLHSVLVSNGRFSVQVEEEDVLHLNDIEELKGEAAESFPYFSRGDLLLSLRNLNMVLVVDRRTWRVKWHHVGPWLRQHDPDFQPDGTITVFDNNMDDTIDGRTFGGSRILSLRPFAPGRRVDVLYGARGEREFFYTSTQGKHRVLPNGNILIVEYHAGRVFEVDSSGGIVWEYINRYDEENVARVSGAIRYPESYFEVEDWSCPRGEMQ